MIMIKEWSKFIIKILVLKLLCLFSDHALLMHIHLHTYKYTVLKIIEFNWCYNDDKVEKVDIMYNNDWKLCLMIKNFHITENVLFLIYSNTYNRVNGHAINRQAKGIEGKRERETDNSIVFISLCFFKYYKCLSSNTHQNYFIMIWSISIVM